MRNKDLNAAVDLLNENLNKQNSQRINWDRTTGKSDENRQKNQTKQRA